MRIYIHRRDLEMQDSSAAVRPRNNAWLQGNAIDAVISYAKLKSYDLRGGYIKCQLVCGLHCFI